jgi:hypothetical protein
MQAPPPRPALPLRLIAGFALRFALVYAVLIVGWPLFAPAYRPIYCSLGNLVFGGGEASVHFRPRETRDPFDVELVLTRKGPPEVRGRATNDSHLVGYLPTVSLIALVIATPIAWKRRRRALLWGLVLVTIFVLLRMAIPIWRDFSRPDALQVYHPGPAARWVLGIAERALLSAPASWFVVPILIWVVVAFRREDWILLQPGTDGPAGSPGE